METNSENPDFPEHQINSQIPIGIITKFLESNSSINIWKWMLLVQDKVFYPAEFEFLKKLDFFSTSESVLDISWGKGFPVTSRIDKFVPKNVIEVGISYDYLFANNSKANLILRDVKSALKDKHKKFKWIRLYLVAQVVRQHGVLLKGLLDLLEDNGKILIFDTRDELMDFYPGGIHLKEMYIRLREYQKNQGGIRDAAERIKKRASDLGFRLINSENVRIPTATSEEREHFFKLICLHIETVERWFPNKFNRTKLFEEAVLWRKDPKCWGSMGLQCVAIGKRSRLGRRLSKVIR